MNLDHEEPTQKESDGRAVESQAVGCDDRTWTARACWRLCAIGCPRWRSSAGESIWSRRSCWSSGALRTDRVGFPFTVDEPGEPKVETDGEGLVVRHLGRGGRISWLEVAAEFCAADLAEECEEPIEPVAEGEITYRDAVVTIDSILPSPNNPRGHFDESKLAELAESIAAHGIAQPLIVRALADRELLELVAGERRLRAARMAGLATVPVRIGTMSEAQADELRIVENLQREDLNPIEEASGFERMLRGHGYTQEKLAERLGCSQPHIANRLRLLKLPEKWRRRVISQEIPPTHARALLPFVEREAILEELEKSLYNRGKLVHPIGSVADFQGDVEYAADEATRAMARHRRLRSAAGDLRQGVHAHQAAARGARPDRGGRRAAGLQHEALGIVASGACGPADRGQGNEGRAQGVRGNGKDARRKTGRGPRSRPSSSLSGWPNGVSMALLAAASGGPLRRDARPEGRRHAT